MAQAAMESLPSARDFEKEGFRPRQARILGRCMDQMEPLNQRISEDLLHLRTFVEENMVTKDDIKNFVIKDDIKDFATKDDIKNFATKDDVKNFVTKDDVKDFVIKDDIKNFATRDDIKGLVTNSQMALEFKQLYRLLFIGMMGICGLILALVPTMLALHLAD